MTIHDIKDLPNICARCGVKVNKMNRGPVLSQIITSNTLGASNRYIALCNKCSRLFKHFLEGGRRINA